MQRDISIGGWCLLHGGSDPFGEPTREFELRAALEAVREAGIKYVSWHDGDLWPADAGWQQIVDRIGEIKQICAEVGVETYNFTTNTFSHPAFRSGGLGSPYPEVRRAAILKACVGMAAAKEFGAENVIFWGGRDGDDGSYASDSGRGLALYLQGVALCAEYACETLSYEPGLSIEPKVYEPRLAGLYASTAATVLAGLSEFGKASDEMRAWAGKIKVNPEYPQHVGMLGLSPVMELELLLAAERLAPFIHFGGQITGRMDCDMLPFSGDNHYANLACFIALLEYCWTGKIELDCRPLRTTTTISGLLRGLIESVKYIRRMEEKALSAFSNPELRDIRQRMSAGQFEDVTLPDLEPAELAEQVAPALVTANAVVTDDIELHQALVAQELLT